MRPRALVLQGYHLPSLRFCCVSGRHHLPCWRRGDWRIPSTQVFNVPPTNLCIHSRGDERGRGCAGRWGDSNSNPREQVDNQEAHTSLSPTPPTKYSKAGAVQERGAHATWPVRASHISGWGPGSPGVWTQAEGLFTDALGNPTGPPAGHNHHAEHAPSNPVTALYGSRAPTGCPDSSSIPGPSEPGRSPLHPQ